MASHRGTSRHFFSKKLSFPALLLGMLLLAQVSMAESGTGAWYRGDLHCHSLYSDGDSTVAAVISSAELRGLDFFIITDHDTHMEGDPAHWRDLDYHSKRMVLLYGIEWTSEKGHASIWSSNPFSYEKLWEANINLDAAAAVIAAHEEGAFFSINHPSLPGNSWEYPVPDGVDFIEVWNAPYRFPCHNRETIRIFWESLLKNGQRIPCVGGSDCHQISGFTSYVNLHGNPTTWVYADERTAESILEGLKAGHASISYAPYGDRLDITADTDGDGSFAIMAGDVVEQTGKTIVIKVQVFGQNRKEQGFLKKRRYTVVLYKNGEIIKRKRVLRNGGFFTLSDIPEYSGYYRAELRGRPEVGFFQKRIYGRTLALTNPIYVN